MIYARTHVVLNPFESRIAHIKADGEHLDLARKRGGAEQVDQLLEKLRGVSGYREMGDEGLRHCGLWRRKRHSSSQRSIQIVEGASRLQAPRIFGDDHLLERTLIPHRSTCTNPR